MAASLAELNPGDEALLDLLRGLESRGYEFVTVTPDTHARVIARGGEPAADLRDVFGWSLPFEPGLLPPPLWDALQRSSMAERTETGWKSRVRVSSLQGQLFVHSAFPTAQADAVFLGPDSYRFAAFLGAEIPTLGTVEHMVDLGAGAGVGAVVAAPFLPGACLTMIDINPLALRFARLNAVHAGVEAVAIEGAGLAAVEGRIDLVIANPPFIIDPARRAYRDGGGMHGAGLSLDWALEAAARLEPGGAMLLYTGSAIAAGRDALRDALEARLGALGCTLRYAEIDPDIFGELIGRRGYEKVERLAAVGAVIRKSEASHPRS